MALDINEILSEYTFSGHIDSFFPVEKFLCNVSTRVEHFIDDIDEIFCSIINSNGGVIDFNSLGDKLGFSVYDNPLEKKYRDEAEVGILNSLLKERVDYGLLQIDLKLNPLISISQEGIESISTRIKYQYFNSVFTGYRVIKFKGLPSNEIIKSFELYPEIGKLHSTTADKIIPECFLDKSLFDTIQESTTSIASNSSIKLLSFKEAHSFSNISQPVIFKLYINTTNLEEIILAYKDDILLTEVSVMLNSMQNVAQKNAVIRDIKFEEIWQNPNVFYDSKLINVFLDKWNWILLIDKQIDWLDENVWEILNFHGTPSVWNKISTVAPVDVITSQLNKRLDKWNWSILSERLSDEIILLNIVSPLFYWDFDILSLKSTSFLRAAIARIREHNNNNPEQKISPDWNFYDITDKLEDDFVFEVLSVNAAINFVQLSTRSHSFISTLLNILGNKYSKWDFDYFAHNWSIDEILNEEKWIGKYINWNIVLQRIAINESLINQYLKSGSLNATLLKYQNNIKSFTTEFLIWDEWLLNYFDSYSLILWQSTRSQRGFDTNEHVNWSEMLLEKYIANFTTSEGKSFFSKKIQSVTFIQKHISFNFDWIAIFDNLERNENLRKEFTADVLYTFREILPWRELCIKIKNDNFILNNIERFKEYFDFKVLSNRSSELIQNLLIIPGMLGELWDWKDATQNVSEEFILENFNNYSWDFHVLSLKESVFIEKAILSNNAYNLLWNWTSIAPKLSTEFIIKILNPLNEKFGKLQPLQIQQFWLAITPILSRDFLKLNASKFIFQFDWNFITRELFTKEEILNNLNNDDERGYWDWSYLLKEKISSEEITNNALFMDIQRAKLLIKDKEKRREVIFLLTKKISYKPELLIYWMRAQKNDKFGIIQMDWELLSTNKQFYFTDSFITEFSRYWKWDLLSAQKNIFSLLDENGKFQTDIRYSVKKRLGNRMFKWDWKVLSKNESLIKNFNIISDQNFIRNWDWAFISQFGKFVDLNKKFDDVRKYYYRLQDFIDWYLFSSRKDIQINTDFLLAFKEKNWDWYTLSESYNLQIDNYFLIEMKEKNWNWNALSRNKSIDFSLPKTQEEMEISSGVLISLMDKEWDWAYLSTRKDVEISYSLLKETLDKPWNYKLLTSHFLKDPLLLENYLRLLANKELDWVSLSSTSKMEFTTELIKEFEVFWNWGALSENRVIKLTRDFIVNFDRWDFNLLTKRHELIDNPHWIFEQSDKKWDWVYIASSSKYLLDEEFVYRFYDKLDFSLLSSNPSVKFTPTLLKKFYKKWNYNSLENNYSITRDNELMASLNEIIDSHSSIKFIQNIESQTSKWKGYIYHFTHLTNAATVINARKILSRNRAFKTGFANAAGSVVENRHDAHEFARFYFRPQTPTQFYNENLGLDSASGYIKRWRHYNGYEWENHSLWKSNYPQAMKLGLPRCPVPVFFRFKIAEVLEKMEPICNISNGNMQTGWAIFGPIKSMINKFNFEDLYSSINDTVNNNWKDYLAFSQQEFLIKDEYDFSAIESVDIIVPDESSKDALLNIVDLDNLLRDRIFVDNYEFSIFHNSNRKVHVSYENEILNVSTDYNDRHFLVVEFEVPTPVQNIDGNIISVSSKEIRGVSQVSASFLNEVPFKVKFIDELNRVWVVYENQKK